MNAKSQRSTVLRPHSAGGDPTLLSGLLTVIAHSPAGSPEDTASIGQNR